MSQDSPSGEPAGAAQKPRLPHHISSVAHVFFSEGEGAVASPGLRSYRQHAITGLSDEHIAAYACAGLVCGAHTVAGDSDLAGVELVEDPGLIWTAGSYLPAVPPGAGQKEAANGGEQGIGIWSHPAPTSDRWWRWTHLRACTDADLANMEMLRGALRSAPQAWHNAPARPAQHGLVVCLFAREVGLWMTAFRMGRLVALLAPPRLEILVFPDGWTVDRVARQRPPSRAQRSTASPEAVIARAGDLARAVAGTCPVHLTSMPGHDAQADQESPGWILRGIARRLATDF